MKKLALILAAIVTMSCFAGSTANAISLNIDVGDHPYYTRGPGYWDNGAYWVWVPGHWGPHHRVWFHGHYARR